MADEENEQNATSLSFRLTVTKRDPVLKLLHPVTGLEPLSWSDDQRLSVCTSRSLSFAELHCNINGCSPEMTLNRSCVPAPLKPCTLL
ncbi:hypothetical protein GDO86_009435, partial [Hymenochirus boettgeri]